MTRYKIGDKVKKGGLKVGDVVEFIDDSGEFVEIQISFVPVNLAGRDDVFLKYVEEVSGEVGGFVN
jgi:hypothetical protein